MWLWHLRSPQALTHDKPAGAGPSIFSRVKEVNPKHVNSYIAALVRDGLLHSISVADGSKNLLTSKLNVTVKGVDRLKEGGSRAPQR